MNRLASIIRKAINLDRYTKDLKTILMEDMETELLGYWLQDYAPKQDLDTLFEQIQAIYSFEDVSTLTDILSKREAYFNEDIYEILEPVIDKTLQLFIKKQEDIIDNFKTLMRTISSPLNEKEFIEYLEKPDTILGKYWSISQRYAVEGKEGHKYYYTFVINRPNIEDIEMPRTMKARLFLEQTEDEISLKPNTQVKLIKLLDKDGKEINLPSSVKNKTFRI